MKLLKTFFLFAVLSVVVAFNCSKEVTPSLNSNQTEKLIDVFELKYGESKTIINNNQSISMKLVDLIDSVNVNCSLVDFIDNQNDNKLLREHVFFSINEIGTTIKVSSTPCGSFLYKNDGNDIQDVKNKINEIKISSLKTSDSLNYYNYNFEKSFGTGTIINELNLKLYLAKTNLVIYKTPNAKKEDYKFILILTTIK